MDARFPFWTTAFGYVDFAAFERVVCVLCVLTSVGWAKVVCRYAKCTDSVGRAVFVLKHGVERVDL